MGMTRREWLSCVGAGAAAAGLAATGVGGCTPTQMRKGGLTVHKNAEFYKGGKFDDQAARNAYFQMMEHFGYPVYDNVRKNMWAIDFGVGRFTDVGMGGIFWVNDKDGLYLGHEIWLLPGQMIPEHWHVKTEFAAKAESWHLRYGAVTLFGEGEATVGAEKIIPASELQFTTARKTTVLRLGDVAPLSKIESKHFMVAGPEGCIVTEYASYHDNNALRFTNPKAKL